MKEILVYGSGMIAKAFLKVGLPKDVVIIAAGVSNSQESSLSEFKREQEMIESILLKHQSKKIVYFSSCSVYQLNSSPYVKHKLAMENLIEKNTNNHLIFRLPQVVGITKNNTIISYFVKSIVKRDNITVHRKTTRSLIDVQDIVRVVLLSIVDKSCLNSTIDICNGTKVPVYDIVIAIGKILSIEPKVNIIDLGESYEIPCSRLKQLLPNDDFIYQSDYNTKLLEKYVPILASQ